MKNRRGMWLYTAILAVCGLLLLPTFVPKLDVQAAEVIATVQGKVMEGTTAKLLYLDTSGGRMEIKIDAETNTGGCKMLLPKKEINVAVSHGSDGYLHAVTISEEAIDTSVSLDMSKVSTVIGTVNKKTTEEMLYLDTDQGEMQLKMDKTTDMSGCSLLVVEGRYSVRCVRGSDAVMHVLSISDLAAATAEIASQTGIAFQADSQAAVNVTGETRTVSGTVKESTNEYMLNLGTSEGDFTFKIDDSTNTSKGMILTPDNKLMVTYYRGTDNNLHASAITGVKDSSSASVDTSSPAAVTGTVKKKSTENILVLDTSAGEMELKLDKVESLSGCKVLVTGKKVSVTCARGDDAYMHALTITAGDAK